MAENNRQRRSFPEAFKVEAVVAIQLGRSATAVVAAELGLPDRLVRAWLRWAEGRTAAGSGAPVPKPTQEQTAPPDWGIALAYGAAILEEAHRSKLKLQHQVTR